MLINCNTINDRVFENGSITSIVFSIHGGMGREIQIFYHRLVDMITENKNL